MRDRGGGSEGRYKTSQTDIAQIVEVIDLSPGASLPRGLTLRNSGFDWPRASEGQLSSHLHTE